MTACANDDHDGMRGWVAAQMHAYVAAERAEVERLMGDLRASEEEQLELRTDAERYRWLRKSHPDDEAGIFVSKERLNGWGRTVAKILRNSDLDKAIDTTRAALATPTQGERQS